MLMVGWMFPLGHEIYSSRSRLLCSARRGQGFDERVLAVATENKETKPISVPVYNRDGAEVGKVEIDPAEFGGRVNKQLVHDVVLMYLANQRAGTHSTLRRGEVAGSSKKIFRQKGTGNARAGTKRTNKRRGGGTAKGPKPRDYEYHLPKKAVRAATRMAILSKFQDNEAIIVEDFDLPAVTGASGQSVIKTKAMYEVLGKLKIDETTCLIGTATPPERPTTPEADAKAVSDAEMARAAHDRLYRSARNLSRVRLMPATQFNAYTVLRQKRLVLTRAALEELRKTSK
jgi:large subunit ribosomal protein L4